LIDKSQADAHSIAFFGIWNRRKLLANSPQARKRARQAEQCRQRNASQRSMLRTYIKNVVKAVAAGDAEAARAAYQSAVPIIDKSAGKGLIHKNKAARHKSRLAQHIRSLQS
jgi:small subunit ribosomal protein S20